MKLKHESIDYILNNESIDACSKKLQAFLTNAKVPKRDIIRHTMTIEEILLHTKEAQGEVPFSLSMGKKLLRPTISLDISGDSFNAFAAQHQNESLLGSHILKSLNLSPEYTYTGQSNHYQFRLQKKRLNPFFLLVIMFFSALFIGILGFFFPDNIRETLLNSVLIPLHDTFLNILGCIAGPMVFLSVAWGIYGIGDASTFKQIGKRVSLSYIFTVAVIAISIGLLCVPFFRLNYSDNVGVSSAASSIFSMVLGVIPKNIFSPFVDGNTLQIIFLSITIGIALLFLGKKTRSIAIAVEQINLIVQFLIEFISKLVPYFIFLVILKILWSNAYTAFLGLGKMLLVFAGAILLMTFVYVIYTAVRNRVSPVSIFIKSLPTFLIAFTTASSAAAFGTNLKACRTKFGIDDSISSFGLPLGIVMFKPATAFNFLISSLFFAEIYQIPLSVSWIATLMFSSIILAIATPPIPGGALASYTVLFSQLGIPTEALAIALACDTLFDFIDTGFDQLLLPYVLLNQARKFDLVNRKVLEK